jgi:glucose/arabinose dehydrogenase
MLAFGPDGKLYVGMGDGGSANDPGDRAQSLDSLLGKILRIDVDSAPSSAPYTIPPDNPYATRTQGAEVWDLGLRNPWRFSFDRATGDLWIGDVGQDHYEEVDLEPAGSRGGVNYGWSRYEGRHVAVADRDAPGAVAPVAEYDHDGGHCSIAGGYVYRGPAVPSLNGAYLFADYCSGSVWTLRPDGHGAFAMAQVLDTLHNVSSFGEDADGELYVVDHSGLVLKVVPG